MNKIGKPHFIARAPKVLKYTLQVVGGIILVFFIAELFRTKVGSFAGSYPFAETWSLDYSVDSLKTSLQALKNETPELFCTADTLYFESDHTGYWHKVQFCYEDKVVYTLIRGYGREATLPLVSIRNNNDSKAKLINRDFDFLANRMEIKAFKKNVVHRLEKDLSGYRVLSEIANKTQK